MNNDYLFYIIIWISIVLDLLHSEVSIFIIFNWMNLKIIFQNCGHRMSTLRLIDIEHAVFVTLQIEFNYFEFDNWFLSTCHGFDLSFLFFHTWISICWFFLLLIKTIIDVCKYCIRFPIICSVNFSFGTLIK